MSLLHGDWKPKPQSLFMKISLLASIMNPMSLLPSSTIVWWNIWDLWWQWGIYHNENMPVAYHLPKFLSIVSSFSESSEMVYWVSPYNHCLEGEHEVSTTHHLMWVFTSLFDCICFGSLDVFQKSWSAHNMSCCFCV